MTSIVRKENEKETKFKETEKKEKKSINCLLSLK
jgi:hypothetical protein